MKYFLKFYPPLKELHLFALGHIWFAQIEKACFDLGIQWQISSEFKVQPVILTKA